METGTSPRKEVELHLGPVKFIVKAVIVPNEFVSYPIIGTDIGKNNLLVILSAANGSAFNLQGGVSKPEVMAVRT